MEHTKRQNEGYDVTVVRWDKREWEGRSIMSYNKRMYMVW
jgi:hypothetical protein